MFSIDEFATILNALRYYQEHNTPHEHESLLVDQISLILQMKREKEEEGLQTWLKQLKHEFL